MSEKIVTIDLGSLMPVFPAIKGFFETYSKNPFANHDSSDHITFRGPSPYTASRKMYIKYNLQTQNNYQVVA